MSFKTVLIEPEFKVGDCVQLSSGGYKMTVNWLYTNPKMGGEPAFSGYVQCTWFADKPLENANVHRGFQFHQNNNEFKAKY